ncbi:MAG: insulinase family protein, partial [Oscillospiraceae bacterium]|nr:insulinase family protein [Oscillospiraceae bacterium]
AAGTATLLAGGESRDPEAVLRAFVAEAERAAAEGIDPDYLSRTLKAAYGSWVRGLSAFGGFASWLADADFGGYDPMDVFPLLSALGEADILDFIRQNLCGPEHYALSVVTPGRGRAGMPDA